MVMTVAMSWLSIRFSFFPLIPGRLQTTGGARQLQEKKETSIPRAVTNESPYRGQFPATPGAFQMNFGGVFDIGILKYDSSGRQLLYATYLGGSDSESPQSLVMNSSEELLVLGATGSFDFPTSSEGFDRTYNGGVDR